MDKASYRDVDASKKGNKMNAPKATRVRFLIAKKVELLDLFRKGRSRTDICRDYGIASSTLFNFIKDESKIRGEFEKN